MLLMKHVEDFEVCFSRLAALYIPAGRVRSSEALIMIVVVNVKSYSVFSGQRIILGDITAVFHLSSTFCLAGARAVNHSPGLPSRCTHGYESVH